MNIIKYAKKSIIVLCIALTCILVGCNRLPVAGEIEYKEIEKNTTKKDLQENLGARPNKTEKQDNLDSYIYEKCKYLSYEGTMTYYLVDDKLLYSRWETEAENKDQGKEIYKKICEDIEKKYSKSSETEEEVSIVSAWSNSEGKEKTVTYLESEDGVVVSIMSME